SKNRAKPFRHVIPPCRYAGIMSQMQSPINYMPADARSGLFLPAALRCLLPVSRVVAFGLEPLPVLPGTFDRRIVAPVEHEDATFVSIDGARLSSVDKEENIRAVRVLVFGRQQNGLKRDRSIVLRTVRQEAVVAIGPEKIVDGVETFRATRPDDGTPSPFERPLEKLREHLLERGI